MSVLAEIRYRLRHVYGIVIGIAVLVYLAQHVATGSRGLTAWREQQQRVAEARQDLAKVQAERQALERQVKLLHPESLDPDMLDEWARRLLSYGLADEIVIFTQKPDGKS